jgi:hypothetical protein
MHIPSRVFLAGAGLMVALGLADRPAFAQAGMGMPGTIPHTYKSNPPPIEVPRSATPGPTVPSTGNPPSLSSGMIYDRWGNQFAENAGLPRDFTPAVLSTSAPAGSLPAGSGSRGLVSLGALPPGVHEIRLNSGGPARDARVTSVSWSVPPAGITGVLISFLVPSAEGHPMQVSHVYRVDQVPGRIRLTVDTGGTTVDWGNALPYVQAQREAARLPTAGTHKTAPGEVLGRVIFVGGTVKY